MQTSFNDEWDATADRIAARFTTTEADADAIVKLRREGWTPEQIAYDMELDYDAVQDVLDDRTDCDLTDHLHFLGE